MRTLEIRSTVAFVTFSMGVSIATLFRIYIPNDSGQPAVQHSESFIETQPRGGKNPPTDSRGAQHADLYIDVATNQPEPKPATVRRLPIELAKHGATVIELDLVESIDNQEVTLNFRGDNEYRVLQRYRTSMTVSDEGDLVDLDGWRHFDSPWVSLKTLGSNRFRTRATIQMAGTHFPPTTTEEIVEAVRERVGSTWPTILRLAKDCAGPNDKACFVAISSIYLSIQKRVGHEWTDVGLVEFIFPMGC